MNKEYWISIKDEMPKVTDKIGYVFDGKKIRRDVYYDHHDKCWQCENHLGYIIAVKNVSHWIAYPKNPIKG